MLSRHFAVFLVGLGVLCFGISTGAGAQTSRVFERGLNGFSGFFDTSIFHDAGGAGTSNAGGGLDGLFVGETAQLGLRRALLRVDLTSIPKGTHVVSATLEITVERAADNFGNVDCAVFRLLKDWGEGTASAPGAGGSGAPAAQGDATWLANHFGTSSWTAPGADFDSTASAVAAVGRAGEVAVWSGPDLAADVQAWIDSPETNSGWIIRGDETAAKHAKRLFSSEADSSRPRLTVVIDGAPAPTDIDSDGGVNAVDVQLVINAALGLDIGGLTADVNGDTFVDAVDVQSVVNAALGAG